MDFAIFYEVLVEKGYLLTLEVCAAALVLLMVMRMALPGGKPALATLKVAAHKLFFEEEFLVSIEVVAKRKITIEELALFVECLVRYPEKGTQKTKSFFFSKKVVASAVPLYPRCSFSESHALKIPEKDKDSYLPGSFTSLKGDYGVIWRAGYTMRIAESVEKIEMTHPLVVYPVTVGW
ncbi:MAG: hypothetical protein RDV48_09140 [Candidatus Eremiobacteraeota bacterium]|nr:hypothetical protein [Candidatus Eremiobacteraeota bacterium]